MYPLALGGAESRDGMTTNQRSRGGASKSGLYTHRHVYTLLNVLSNILSVYGEKINLKYRPYQACISPDTITNVGIDIWIDMPTPTWTVKLSVYCVRQVWLGTFFSGMLNCSVSWKSDFILQCLSQQFCSYFAYKFKWQMSFFSLRYFTNCVDSKRLNEYRLSEKSFPICVLV